MEIQTKPSLQNFDSELSLQIIKLGYKKTFGANEQVFVEGEQATFLPIVLAGKVKLVRYPEVGKEVILGVFSSGEVFAIPPALDGKRFPATAVAISETQLLMLPRREFLDLMESSVEFSSIIMARMCGLLRDRTDTVQILATPSAEHRVASVILKLACDVKVSGTKKILHRRQDIAEMSGLTIETTIRAIRKLAEKGLLKIVRGKIHLETDEYLRDFLR